MAEALNKLAYRKLRQDIIFLTLKPGTVLSTQEVATRYEVSRTPAREAIVRLNKEGLVDVFPQSKTMVSRIDLKRIQQEWFIRKSLEVAVIDEFMKNCSLRDLESLEKSIERQANVSGRGMFRSFFESDYEFHRRIFEIAEQLLSWETIANVNCHYDRMRMLIMSEQTAQTEAIEEHRQIVAAMRERDVPLIKRQMVIHTEKFGLQQQAMLERYPDYFSGMSSDRQLKDSIF